MPITTTRPRAELMISIDCIRIDRLGGIDWVTERADLHRRIGEHALCQLANVCRAHQGLIALQVDVDISLDLFHDFAQAIGARRMIR